MARLATLAGLTRSVSVSMVRARFSLVRSICLTSWSGSRSATSPFASAIACILSSRQAQVISLPGEPALRTSARGQRCAVDRGPAVNAVTGAQRQPPGTGHGACLLPREVLRGADQAVAGAVQLTGIGNRRVLEGGVLKILLDHARQLVSRLVKVRQCLVGGEVLLVTGALALDALGREPEGRGAERAHAGVELLVT